MIPWSDRMVLPSIPETEIETLVLNSLKVVGGMKVAIIQTWTDCTSKEVTHPLLMVSTGIIGMVTITHWKQQRWRLGDNDQFIGICLWICMS